MVVTRSRRIRAALRTVLRRIPVKDRQTITAFVRQVWATLAWEVVGLGSELKQSSAELLPLYDLGVPEAERPHTGQVVFSLPVCRLFSDRALVGIVAHELAHAARIAKLGPGAGWERWYDQNPRKYRAEERHADAIASAWGFGPHIRALRRERQAVVTPTLQAREPELIRHVLRRWERMEERARRQWEARKRQQAEGSKK